MSDAPVHVVILAAGKGTRMKSSMPKVLHRVAGVPMIDYVLSAAAPLAARSTTVVIGHGADAVREHLCRYAGLTFVLQEPQLGTGHALLTTEPLLGREVGTLVLLSGDVPLLTADTVMRLVSTHRAAGAAATVVTAQLPDPAGYGRVVRAGQQIARIVEDRDATPEERAIREVNAGIYAFEIEGLFEALRRLAAANAQREYYLPDLVAAFVGGGRPVATVSADPDEIRGVNSRAELESASRLVRMRTNDALMASGVTLEDAATAYVERGVQIGPDTILHPHVSLEGATSIGSACEIHSGARIVNSRIGNRVVVHNHSVITDSVIEDDAQVGPFARLRSQAVVRPRARVGNFVEMKKTELGAGSKAMHLAYLGDSTVGERVNIGAGTITCNYDGERKQRTTIEDGAFIGSYTQLVAPVTVGRDAYIGTGTTVREDVPAGALAVSAGKQRNIEGWVDRRRRREGPRS